MILFPSDIILCVQEFLNFELGVIEGYGYEVSRSRLPLDRLPEADEYCRPSYTEKDKLYWYDSLFLHLSWLKSVMSCSILGCKNVMAGMKPR